MATVTLRDVRKSFGKTEVIHGVDAHVEDGEFVVIVGPSGCGKSTLLRMVAGLETVTSGHVSIDGKVVNDLEPMDRDIAMVFQNYALYPHMTVRANMAYGLKIAKLPKPEIESRVAEASAMLQLDPYLDRLPRQLSGGQRQRVAMGRAIVREPAVFLFDEPLSNLDAKLRVAMRLEIKELQSRLGITSLYVTHDQVEAMTLADRMIVMNDGRAEQIGRPLDVYRDPATTFVASFIGSPPMNLFEASAMGFVGPAGAATAGIRPEHVAIATQPAAGGELRPELPAEPDIAVTQDVTVRYCEPLGAETLVHIALPGGELLTARLSAERDIPPAGSSVMLSFERSHIVFFDDRGFRLPG